MPAGSDSPPPPRAVALPRVTDTRPSTVGSAIYAHDIAYRKNHVASQCYLDQWVDADERLVAVRPPAIEGTYAKPENVGYRRDFWAREPHVRRVAEQHLNRIESDAATALRQLDTCWPLTPGSRDWLALTFLVALHLWRNPYGQRHLIRIQQDVLTRRLPDYATRLDGAQLEALLSEVTSDAWRAELMLEDLPKTASVIGSMHCTLMEFAEPVLATGDQPVTIVPLLRPGTSAEVTPLPRGPLLDCEEIRIAVGPHHALLFTWLDEPADAPALRGSDELAAQLNRAVIGQADREWFHNPARRPTTLVPPLLQEGPCRPVGRAVLADYGRDHALRSRRRRETAVNLETLIEEEVTGEVRVVGVRRNTA